jgi:hypothetical protein
LFREWGCDTISEGAEGECEISKETENGVSERLLTGKEVQGAKKGEGVKSNSWRE